MLVTLLEILGFTEVAAQFWEAGLFVSVELQIELLEALHGQTREALQYHRVDQTTFLQMFDVLGSYIEARATYVDHFFPWGAIKSKAIQALLDSHLETDHDRVWILLEQMANELKKRNIFAYMAYFEALLLGLRAFLQEKGRLAKDEEAKKLPLDEDKDELSWACRLFDIPKGLILTGKTIQKQYRNLMKRWHPDVNSQGLQKSQEINKAYRILLDNIALA